MIRSLWNNMLDRIADRVGVWALRRMFGGCDPEHYTEGCVSCMAARLIEIMRLPN